MFKRFPCWYFFKRFIAFSKTSLAVSVGTTNGTASTSTSHGGTGGTKVNVTNINGTVLCTAGGGGDSDAQSGSHCSGASGKITSGYINVTPGQKISYAVGGFGYGWDNGTAVTSEGAYRHKNDSGTGAGSGYYGIILVEWGKGVG